MSPSKRGIQVHSHTDMFCDCAVLSGCLKTLLNQEDIASPISASLQPGIQMQCVDLKQQVGAMRGYTEDGGAPQLKKPRSRLTAFIELITLVSRFNQQ